ncbi:MAG: signal peptidase I [Cyanobacteria bacterium J06626_18]
MGLFHNASGLVLISIMLSTSLYLGNYSSEPSKLWEVRISQSLPSIFENPEEFLQDFEARYMQSSSMQLTIEVNDRILIDKHTYRSDSPQRSEIVIFDLPITEETANSEATVIHRIVGLPGEMIEVKAGQVYIDDQLLEESYLSGSSGFRLKIV